MGDCFGTLKKLEGRAANSRILTVVTKEPNCEFLKISTSDFTSVQEQVRLADGILCNSSKGVGVTDDGDNS